jgi:RNA polymerase sigma factor (TIGR02999 family)
MNEVTRILSAIDHGDPKAPEQLLPLVYEELRRLAAQRLAQEKPGQTLQATALVHEAYLRLVDGGAVQCWDSRGHFFAAAAEAMRRILVDNARRKRAEKRGGQLAREDLDGVAIAAPAPSEDLLALDEALAKLEAKDPVKARLVKLRYFAGLSEEEAAQALGISRTTAHRHWRYARVWLLNELEEDGEPPKNRGKPTGP